MRQVSGRVHLDVGIRRLSHQVSTHGIQQLVHGGGLGEKIKKRRERTRKRNSLRKFVDHAFRPMYELRDGLHRSMGITPGEGSRDAAQATISSTESLPERYVASSVCWWAMGRAWYCAKISAAASGGTAGRRAGTKYPGTWSQEEANKGFESCEKAKKWKLWQIQRKFVQICTNFEIFDSSVN